ncbi:glycosyltransferase family 4 protein [Cytophagales bacterium LB-30]|uniref:Glycosyltransferase family 4 protein n=1 Tax=Shiella aurantiaca TaxID=3058365 RepID=A0ABT8F8C0_9BACT|nr:glycosyltransferase family 4 protein [Shiella aurantiaca]MDN4166624.1 glycosyltransferase family 4 protein [Shiella aurantiaca]
MNIILKGQLGFMNQFFEVVGITSPDEKHFVACGEREGIRMIPVPMQRTISPLKDLVALWHLFWIFKREKPSIVHTHTPKAGLLGLLAAKLANVPIKMHTVGGMPLTEVHGAKKKLLILMEGLTYACADRVYPNSFGLNEIILKHKLCSKAKLKVLANGSSNGVNTEYFSPFIYSDTPQYLEGLRNVLGIAAEDFVFLFVGRLAKDKGIVELVEAFKRVYQEHTHAKLLLIGPYEQSNSILPENTRNEISNHPAIMAPGRFDDVRPYYALSQVYVFPSYREGFPNSLMEAGAMGLPIIASDINGCNEIVEHNKNGLLISPKSINSLFDAMIECLENEEFLKHLKGQSRKFILDNFRNKVVWDELYKEYQTNLKPFNQ